MATRDESVRFETRAADWLTDAEAQELILRSARLLPYEHVPLEASDGRVLAEPVIARWALPPWDNSAMDGYAVRASDVKGASTAAPVTLTVVGNVHAGDHERPRVEPGQAVRIMTGAPLPEGSDAVVRVEDTDREERGNQVRIRCGVKRGRYVRPGGQDFRKDEELLHPGTVVDPGIIALAAAAGQSTLAVCRKPIVALLATGDELRGPERYDDVVRGIGIPESNTPMLAAMVRAAGGIPRSLGIAPDDPTALRERVTAARSADVLVTVGGASMGEADLVKRVLDDMGFRQAFWRVRIRPGSPFAFGHLSWEDVPQPVFSLPGNPSSAFVTFELFVRPFLRALTGHEELTRPTISCTAAEDLTGPRDLTAYLRVRLGGFPSSPSPVARLTGPQGSGLVSGLGHADGLAVLPIGVDRIPAGQLVTVLLLRERARGAVPEIPTTRGPGTSGSPS